VAYRFEPTKGDYLRSVMRKLALPVLFAILVVDAIIASLLYPVFSRYTAGLSMPELWFGLAMFAFSFFQLLSAPALGALSDQKGRSPIFRLAAMGTFVATLLLLPVRYVLFFGNRVIDGTTNGLYGVVKSAVADLSKPEDIQRNVGLSATISYVGLLLGPAVAAGVLWMADRQGWNEIRSLVVAGLLFAAINMVLSTILPETKRGVSGPEASTTSWRESLSGVAPRTMLKRAKALRTQSPQLARLLSLVGLLAVTTGYYTYFIIFVADGPLQLNPRGTSYLFLYFALIGILTNTVFFGKIAHRLRPIPTLRTLFILGILTMGLYASTADQLWILYVALTIDMCTLALVPGFIEGLIGLETDEANRGEVFGLSQGISSLMGLLAIALYTVASLIDLRLPFFLFSLPLVVGLFVIPKLQLHGRPPVKNQVKEANENSNYLP
jgi:MFS transporter, DHA1 family, tetracycline resistance protein